MDRSRRHVDILAMRQTRRNVLAGAAGAGILLSTGLARAQDSAWTAARDSARGLDQLHSIAIAQDGEERWAETFRGPGLNQAVNIKSVSKTLVATLTGAAIDRGLIMGVDQPVAPLLGDLVPGDADPVVQRITVEDLLTLQMGLERTSGPGYGAFVASSNWVRHVLSRPQVAEPGAQFLYSTGSTHVMGVVLARVAEQSLLQLARGWLGTPLDIGFAPWTRDPQGYYMGGNNMVLSPRALLRFAEMIRRGGEWNGERVISPDWIQASWTPRTRSPFSGDLYGYGWFLTRIGDHAAAYGRGYGGQIVMVVPNLRASLVITSDPNRPARSEGHFGDLMDLIATRLLPVLGA